MTAKKRGLMRVGVFLFSFFVLFTAPQNIHGGRSAWASPPENETEAKEKDHQNARKEKTVKKGAKDKRRQLSERLKQVWARFKREPSLRDVQKAAIRYAFLKRDTVRSWKKRVRAAAWLPQLKVGLDRSHGAESRLKGEPGTSNEWKEKKDADLSYGVQLKWSFDRLIFDANELKVSREAQRLVELREEVMHGVTRVFFERRRLQVMNRLRPPRSVRSAARRRLARERLEGLLDAMTGGWFGRELKKRRRQFERAGRRS